MNETLQVGWLERSRSANGWKRLVQSAGGVNPAWARLQLRECYKTSLIAAPPDPAFDVCPSEGISARLRQP